MKPTQTDPYAAETKRNALALGIGIGVLVALLVIGGGLAALGLFGPKGQTTVAQAPADTPAVLPQAASPNTPALPMTPMEKPKEVAMPDDIYRWLEHLRITEERRKSLSGDHMGDLLVMMTKMKAGGGIMDALHGLFGDDRENAPVDIPESKAETVQTDAAQKRKDWQALQDFFLSYPPPSECSPIQASYAQALGETSAMMMEVLDAIEMADQNPEAAIAALTKMQGTSSGRIDTLAKQTDDQVQDICDKYKTRKWFSINADFGGGMMNQFGGF